MAELLARGLRARPSLLDQAEVTAPVSVNPAGGASQFERGLRSSLAGQSAAALATEGLQAEIAGRNDVAAEKYRQAEIMRGNAATAAPRVTSLRDVRSFDDAADFAAGGLPQVMTSMVPAVAGAVVGRGIGGRIGMGLGGMVPAYNMEADETIGALATDPAARSRMTAEQIQSLGRAKGAVNAGLEVAGPAYLLERALGKTAAKEGLRGAAKTIGMGGLVEGPLTELPQEVIGQAAQSYARTGDAGKEIDPWALADAAALGAMGGHAMAVPAAGVHLARGAVDKGVEAVGAGVDTASEAVAGAANTIRADGGIALNEISKKADPILDRIKAKVGTAYDAGRMDWLIAKNEHIPDEIASDPEAVMQHIAAQDGERKQYVRDYLTNIVNTADNPARVQQAADFLENLDDPETYRTAAAGIVGMEKTKQFQQRTKDFIEDAKDFGKGLMDGPKKKSNAQSPFDATTQLVNDELLNSMPAEARDGGAEEMLPYFRGMFTGKVAPALAPRIMRDFIGIYGDDAINVAARASQHITRDSEGRGLDPQRTVKLMQNFMADEEVRADTRNKTIEDALTNEARVKMQAELGRPVSPEDVSVVTDLMTRLTEGSLSKDMAPRVEKELKKYLGPRYTHAVNIFRAMHDAAARNSAPLVHAEQHADVADSVDSGSDALDYDAQAQAVSLGTMMEGKDREFSLAKKADASGVAPFFDSREEAQARWDEKIAPVHIGKTGKVIRGDEYVALTGEDPLKHAAQYDQKFAQEPADFKQKAELAKEAMALLRNKYAVQMDVVTNEDTDRLGEKELDDILKKSSLPVVKREQMRPGSDRRYVNIGDGNVRDTKPTLEDGYIFVGTADGKHRAVKASALTFAMKGKQKKGDLSGPDEGAEGTLSAALAGLARLGDSGQLDLSKGVFGYNADGSQRWLMNPKGENQKGLSKLRVGKEQTLGGLNKQAQQSYVARRREERNKAAKAVTARLMQKIDDVANAVEALRDDLADAKASGNKVAIRRAANAAGRAQTVLDRLRNYKITEADIDSYIKEGDWTRGAERNGLTTDTDPVAGELADSLEAAKNLRNENEIRVRQGKTLLRQSSDRARGEDDANFEDVQRRTREQSRRISVTKPQQVAGEARETLGQKEIAKLSQNANKVAGYLNDPPADYTPQKAVDAKAWAERWLFRTQGMAEAEDLRATLAVVHKVASQMIESDKAASKKGGRKSKKANAMSTRVHDELGRDGIAATHDSPIRHEGKFDWRAHIGKGEGNAAFGAGTYLSTANSVHRSYKGQFTAAIDGDAFTPDEYKNAAQKRIDAIRDKMFDLVYELEMLKDPSYGGTASEIAQTEKEMAELNAQLKELTGSGKYKGGTSPTYHVTVNIKRDELLDWDAPLSEQSAKVKAAMAASMRGEIDTSIKRAMSNIETNKYGEVVKSGYLNGEKFSMAVAKQFSGKVKVRARIATMLDEKRFSGEFDSEEAAIDAMAQRVADQRVTNVLGSKLSGKALYSNLAKELGSQAKASDFLQDHGVLGHVYNAAGGKEENFRNYVIYDDSRIETNYVSFNKQGASKVASDEEVADAKAYVKKVLGDKIKLAFEKDLGGISGEWEEGMPSEPPLKSGYVRLYRGEGGANTQSQIGGDWFTTSRKQAEAYGAVSYIDVLPQELGSKFAQGHHFKAGVREEYVLGDAALKRRVRPLPTGSSTANIIRIALNAGPGVLSVAHHEAMHEFFARLAKLGRADVQQILLTAANSPMMMRKLERLLDGETAALAQIKNDPEERLAYMYQFWAAGKLTVGPSTQTVFQKIAAFFRRVAGMISNDERAAEILAAFHEGKMAEPSAAAAALGEIMTAGTTAQEARKAMKPLYDKAYGFVMPSSDVLGDSNNPYAKRLGSMMYTGLVGENNGRFGYLNAVRAKTGEWDNRFSSILEGMGGDEVKLLLEVMRGKKTTFAPVRKAGAELRTLLKDFRDYMVDRGVDIGNRENYFPRVWDFEKIAENKAKFVNMLMTKYPDKVSANFAVKISNTMTMLSGVEQHGDLNESDNSAGYTPYMQAVNAMKLDFIKDEDAQEFLEGDMIKIMTSYLKQGVRRAEYESRFGERGAKLEELLVKAHDYEVAQIKKENPDLPDTEVLSRAADRAKQFTDAAHAMEGTIGYDKIGPKMRKFTSWMLAYQSMRLLPLTLFSSMIDPLGMVVRGGDLDTALAAYMRGIKEVVGTWRGKDTRDGMTKTAEMLGVIEHQSFLDNLGYVHESMYMDAKAKRLTDKFFRWNGMEAWNRAMRTQATAAALDFIKEHGTEQGEHSARWLKELGLTAADVRTVDGELVLWKEDFKNLGMDDAAASKAAEKMQMAVNQWVDGSMLRPNAALRPSWSSDPRFALLFYLKQFTYAFQKTFLARVRSEFRHGNTAPLAAMLPFVPVMIASDIARGMLQNGGDLPNYMKGWNVSDYLIHGVQRAGLTGIAQFGLDETVHPTDIFGPVVGQGVDLFTKPIETNVAEAIPGVSVFN